MTTGQPAGAAPSEPPVDLWSLPPNQLAAVLLALQSQIANSTAALQSLTAQINARQARAQAEAVARATALAAEVPLPVIPPAAGEASPSSGSPRAVGPAPSGDRLVLNPVAVDVQTAGATVRAFPYGFGRGAPTTPPTEEPPAAA